MAKPKGVNRYRSGIKNRHQEVQVYTDPDGAVKVHLIDFEKGKVTSFEEKGKPDAPRY